MGSDRGKEKSKEGEGKKRERGESFLGLGLNFFSKYTYSKKIFGMCKKTQRAKRENKERSTEKLGY